MALPSRPASQQLEATAVPGEPLIAFKDVRIGFDEGDVLRGISFEVWPGETKVLLGESGSGKTLIMKLACGLLRPDQGRIWVMGEDLGAMSENELLDFRRHVGFVFQEGALFDSLTVADNVAFRLREENLDDAEIEARVREVLRFVEMEPAIYMFPGELSGGMRRRVSIARSRRPPAARVLRFADRRTRPRHVADDHHAYLARSRLARRDVDARHASRPGRVRSGAFSLRQ